MLVEFHHQCFGWLYYFEVLQKALAHDLATIALTLRTTLTALLNRCWISADSPHFSTPFSTPPQQSKNNQAGWHLIVIV
jgi:hypothetical protein